MGRAGWVLFLLLLVTNAAWFLMWSDEDGATGGDDAHVADLEQTVTDLEEAASNYET